MKDVKVPGSRVVGKSKSLNYKRKGEEFQESSEPSTVLAVYAH